MKNLLNNLSVKTKLIALTLAIVIFTLVALSVTYTITFVSGATKYERQKREEQTVAIAKEIEDLIQSAYIVSGNIEINNDIVNTLQNFSVGDEIKIKTVARQIIAVNSREIKDFTIYLETDEFSSSGYIVTVDSIGELNQTEWGEYLLQSNKNVVVCAWGNRGNAVLSIVRYSFIDVINETCVCRFDINLDTVYSVFNSSMIVDEGGYTGLICDGKSVAKRGSEKDDSFDCEYKFTKYKMMENLSVKTKTPRTVINHQPFETGIILSVISMVVLVLLVIILLAVITPINDRLKLLQTAMVSTTENEYKPIEIEESKDEIGQSIVAYNQMVNKINEMFERIYQDAVSKTKLESDVLKSKYISLKSQIDPHFIYNVLNSIYAKSIIKGEDETARVIFNFSQMLRENLLWSKDTVTLEEEFENIDRYILIQKYRFDDNFEFELTCSSELYSLILPKMTVLTLVENTFKHALENSSDVFKIKVKCQREGVYYIIAVYDNGSPLLQSEIDDIYFRVLKEDGEDDDPKGIANVLSRIKYYYDNVSFSIENADGGKWFKIKFKEKRNNETSNS